LAVRVQVQRVVGLVVVACVLSACGSSPKRSGSESSAGSASAAVVAASKSTAAGRGSGGGYYLDDGPDARQPDNLDQIADATPRLEPLHRFANRPYTVLGQSFVPMTELKPFRELGHGSWYGRRFHGKPTSSGEPYDMYAMTAAHPTLPIPSYARVRNVANGRSVVVRVNDRGPFLKGRVIDLSYTAAYKLGYVNAGSAQVEVELILPQQLATASASATTAAHGAGLVPELASASGGIFLQLGAFSSRSNAEAYQASIAQQVALHAPGVELFRDGQHFRLHAGPYASVEDARQAANRLGLSLNPQPFVVVR
jgi:rare lipoprotein A